MQPIAPALSSDERKLHRHAGIVSQSPLSDNPLGPVINELPQMEPLAQFADSYILVQAEDELLLVDQHALHERVRYERLRHNEAIWESQPRISPLEIDLDARQLARLDASKETLEGLGFCFEQKNSGWVISSAPALLSGDEMQDFVHDLLLDVSEDGAPITTVEEKKDHLAFLNACRGAVKANDKLTLPEMRRLLDDMRRIPNPWACVHGRPTAMRIPLNALDQHFGRHG